MGNMLLSSHLSMSAPASTAGVSLQVMFLVPETITLPQASVPVIVIRAVKEPSGTEGVKVASAALLFCVQVPSDSPPDHSTDEAEPPCMVPVIGMGSYGAGVHKAISGPADTEGNPFTVSRAASDLKAQPPCPWGVFISTR